MRYKHVIHMRYTYTQKHKKNYLKFEPLFSRVCYTWKQITFISNRKHDLLRTNQEDTSKRFLLTHFTSFLLSNDTNKQNNYTRPLDRMVDRIAVTNPFKLRMRISGGFMRCALLP